MIAASDLEPADRLDYERRLEIMVDTVQRLT